MKGASRVIVKKIRHYCVKAIEFKAGMSFEEFSTDLKTISACVFNLSQIGELVGRLDDSFITNNTRIPWRKIKGLRNKIVHEYEGLHLFMIWDVLDVFIPRLLAEIDTLLDNSNWVD